MAPIRAYIPVPVADVEPIRRMVGKVFNGLQVVHAIPELSEGRWSMDVGLMLIPQSIAHFYETAPIGDQFRLYMALAQIGQ